MAGDLHVESYTDREGHPRTANVILGNGFNFLGSSGKREGQAANAAASVTS